MYYKVPNFYSTVMSIPETEADPEIIANGTEEEKKAEEKRRTD